jgi:hypothetical protein
MAMPLPGKSSHGPSLPCVSDTPTRRIRAEPSTPTGGKTVIGDILRYAM